MEMFGSKILRLAKMHILDKFETLLKHEKGGFYMLDSLIVKLQ